MSKHTRGNWTILPEEADKEYIRIRGTVLSERYKIANVHHKTIDFNSKEFEKREYEETYANARLIAAAPDLLEALEALLHSEWQDDEGHPRLTQARDKARAAIAKAKE